MDKPIIRALLIADDAEAARSVGEYLRQAEEVQIELQHERRLSAGLDNLARNSIDVVLLDLRLPDSSGLDTLRRTRRQNPEAAVVVLGGSEAMDERLRALDEGAADYLDKSQLDGPLLTRTIRCATGRRRAEKALRESEQRYRELLAAMTTYTYSVELKGGVPVSTEHGQGCLATTGYVPEDYAMDPCLWLHMVHPDDRDAVQHHVAKVLAGERVPPLQHRICHRDGTTRWARDTIVPHYDGSGRLIRYDGLVEDITERKRAEDALRHNEARLLAARNVQERLLPSSPPKLIGYDVAGASFPSEMIGGDYFDFIPMLDDCMGIAIGDSSGHGLGSALLAAELRATVCGWPRRPT